VSIRVCFGAANQRCAVEMATSMDFVIVIPELRRIRNRPQVPVQNNLPGFLLVPVRVGNVDAMTYGKHYSHVRQAKAIIKI